MFGVHMKVTLLNAASHYGSQRHRAASVDPLVLIARPDLDPRAEISNKHCLIGEETS